MIDIHDKINSDYRVIEDTVLHGMTVGNVNVQMGARFFIYGMIIGNLNIDVDSQAVINGTVNGNINSHGKCEIFGTINGKVTKKSGELIIDQNSKINS